jgi:putative transposase
MHFYTDNRGNKIENPRHLRKSEKTLKRLQRWQDVRLDQSFKYK